MLKQPPQLPSSQLLPPLQLSPRTEVVASVVAYSICSGSLVLLNKLILHRLPFPSLVITFQLVAALAFIFTASRTGKLQVDPLRWKYVVPYLYYIVAFAMGVYCNMRSLSVSNVETVVVFRALSPCLVAMLDAIFLGREYPSRRSWIGIGTIVVGAYGYASFDEEFQNQGWSAYFWPFCYMCIISFEMVRMHFWLVCIVVFFFCVCVEEKTNNDEMLFRIRVGNRLLFCNADTPIPLFLETMKTSTMKTNAIQHSLWIEHCEIIRPTARRSFAVSI